MHAHPSICSVENVSLESFQLRDAVDRQRRSRSRHSSLVHACVNDEIWRAWCVYHRNQQLLFVDRSICLRLRAVFSRRTPRISLLRPFLSTGDSCEKGLDNFSLEQGEGQPLVREKGNYATTYHTSNNCRENLSLEEEVFFSYSSSPVTQSPSQTRTVPTFCVLDAGSLAISLSLSLRNYLCPLNKASKKRFESIRTKFIGTPGTTAP